MKSTSSTNDVLERVRSALRRRDYAEAAEIAGELHLEPEPERVSDRMRRTILEVEPSDNQDMGRHPATR